jgi:hypothetical protein
MEIINELINIFNIIGDNPIFNACRSLFILLSSIYSFVKLFFKKKYSKNYDANEHVRKIFDDYEKNKNLFYFSLQKYIGMKLSINEMEFIINNNFYILSKNIKHAYSKLKFENNEYKLKYPNIGFIWALLFYLITVIPTSFYILFIPDIIKIISFETWLLFSIIFLPIFLFFSILAIINSSMFGAAESICKYGKNTNCA